MHDIQIRVIPALRLRGSRNAGIPFEIASTPVRAVVPWAKACRSRKGATTVNVPPTCISGGATTVPSVPVKYRTRPIPTVRIIDAKKKNIGNGKDRPDARTPRRLTTVTRSTRLTASVTRYVPTAGNAETICATPDETETETVR